MTTQNQSFDIVIEELQLENRWLKFLLRLIVLGILHDEFRYGDKKEQDQVCAAIMEHAM